jgi:tetratricopeptide (TPR) repeat protein
MTYISDVATNINTLVSSVYNLIFVGRYATALALIDDIQAKVPTLQLDKEKGICYLTRDHEGDLLKAEECLLNALAFGDSDALSWLAGLHRVQAKSRAWMLTSERYPVSPLECAIWERELSNYYFDLDDINSSRKHLERGLNIARSYPEATHALPSLARVYSATMRRFGFDQVSVTILKEALKITLAARRVPLLIEHAYSSMLIGDLKAARELIAEVQVTHPPQQDSRVDFAFRYVIATVHHLENDIAAAREAYDETYQATTLRDHHMAFYTAVWAAMLELEPTTPPDEDHLDADVWAMLARDVQDTVPQGFSVGWLALLEALKTNQCSHLTLALHAFESIQAKREQALVWSLQAVLEARSNEMNPLKIDKTLRKALAICQEIGSVASMDLAMRFLEPSQQVIISRYSKQFKQVDVQM